MKPPKVIYLQVCGECNDHDCDRCKFEDLAGISWCQDKVYEKDVAYFSEQAVRDLLRKEYEQANSIIDYASRSGRTIDGGLIHVDKSIEVAIKKLKGGEDE